MRAFLVVSSASHILASDLASDELWPKFQGFMEKYDRQYATESETTGRFEIFKDNLKLIDQRNAQGTAKHGVNQFTDLSSEEFANRYLRRESTTSNFTKKVSQEDFAKKFSFMGDMKAENVDWCAAG